MALRLWGLPPAACIAPQSVPQPLGSNSCQNGASAKGHRFPRGGSFEDLLSRDFECVPVPPTPIDFKWRGVEGKGERGEKRREYAQMKTWPSMVTDTIGKQLI